MSEKIKSYSTTEEKMNVYSHLFGLLLSIVGLILLLVKSFHSGTVLSTVSYAIFGASMITLYLASTLYHASVDEKKRKRLNVFDHSAIYVLIAGTYTPFSLLGLQGAWGWSIFGVVWGIAVIGVVLKLFFTGRFRLASTISYVLMGWVIVVAIKPLIERFPFEGLMWLAAGGFSYTFGAVLYQVKRIPYNHALFHFFVLLGTFTHFMGVYLYTK